MSIYTLKGSEELDAHISADLKHIAEAAAPYGSAGILLGGYGRGEGTPFIHADGSQTPFNDYDLVVVVDKLNGTVRNRFKELEQGLSKEIGLPVDLCPYHISHLRRCEFSLLNYEMKYGHKVVWGDPEILASLPDYPHDGIPLSEGLRLLLNRGKLLLDIRQRLLDHRPLKEEERIRFIKFIHKVWLAFGDCALLAAGEYDVSYSVKKMRFPAIGHCPERDVVVQGYQRAIELKDWGDYPAPEAFNVEKEFNQVLEIYLLFMPWYRGHCTGNEGSALKNIALNSKWNRCLSATHPRCKLYDAVVDLLCDRPSLPIERFYALQRRFS